MAHTATAVDVVPAAVATQRWFTMRRLMLLLMPLRVIAVVGLAVLIGHIVRERGDVDRLVWLRLAVLSLLAVTVWEGLP